VLTTVLLRLVRSCSSRDVGKQLGGCHGTRPFPARADKSPEGGRGRNGQTKGRVIRLRRESGRRSAGAGGSSHRAWMAANTTERWGELRGRMRKAEVLLRHGRTCWDGRAYVRARSNCLMRGSTCRPQALRSSCRVRERSAVAGSMLPRVLGCGRDAFWRTDA
jgi:hypothetical protein